MPSDVAGSAAGLEKAATLMIALGPEASAPLLRNMTHEEVCLIGREIARLKHVSSETAQQVIDEFWNRFTERKYVASGGVHCAREMLVSALGAERGGAALNAVLESGTADAGGVAAIRSVDPLQLVRFIENEQPQTVALVLSQLVPSQASVLLQQLPAEMRADVLVRMANLDRFSSEAVDRIARILAEKLETMGAACQRSQGGVRAVAEILNGVQGPMCEEILGAMAQAQPQLAESIQNAMFLFEDLAHVGKDAIRAIASRVDRKVLTMALKGTSEELKNQFTGTMSQRAAEMLKEDMEALGPVRIRDVETAQKQVIAVARELQTAGEISLRGEDAEQMVR